jgi:coenzyme F420-0:L-glutamate ligase/coenzyme F420-1:gamma-L-glutamate ligase
VRSPPRPPVTVLPVEGVPEVRPGDDLAAVLEAPLRAAGVLEGDVVVVTSKVVSKAEGRIVRGADRTDAISAETARVVARRGDLVIAETAHGFVCANAGVDASNVDTGSLALLPEDPDASAARLRARLSALLDVRDLAVVVTDTFGRAWRIGVVNVAIGCDGLPAVVDLRGRADDRGRELEATEVALADEVAAASGLVIAKDAQIPAAIVRGVDRLGSDDGSALDLVRPADEDLFRASPLQALHDRRARRTFGPGAVTRSALEEAIAAASTAWAPHQTKPWRFSVLFSDAARRGYVAAVEQRRGTSDEVLAAAPVLIVPWVSLESGSASPDAGSGWDEREMLVLSGGAAVQNLLLALSAQGLASSFVGSTMFDVEETRVALGVGDGWLPLGTVACGPMPGRPVADPRPPIDPADVAEWR